MARQPEPIAIVGSGCRFPGDSTSPSKLWSLIREPRDVVCEIPPERFNTTGFYHADGNHHGTTNVRHSYLMNDADLKAFDAAFFNISPNEADSIDPQQRLLLETVYEAMEAGGHTLKALRGSDTAVYVGTMGVDYNDALLRDLSTIPTYFATGTNRAIISNRVSYFFDWHGPSMTIDTACSSSLIAVHQGVQALRTGESRVAVACGTQVILGPEVFIFESKMKMLSPTGRSRMWDSEADGYARGEGVAAIVLKRLSDAIADGDHIECVIRETGANQDGFSNGITVPNTEAQAMLISQTYRRAGLDPANNPDDRPQFFEAHGTGTKAGDPKEAAAIHECLGKFADEDAPLYVGSVKTVIGHTEGAAGLAGLLKGSGIIQQGFIPPNLLFNNLNPAIKPFYEGVKVPTTLQPWPKLPEGVPRRVSVNSFGFGGSNAHAILEEYRPEVEVQETPSRAPFTPFVFSAASEASLVAQLQAYSDYLGEAPDIHPADLAWTLQSRRSQLSFKLSISAATIEELKTKIDEKLAPLTKTPGTAVGIRSNTKITDAPRVLGVFTGQGAQWPAMGADLIRSSRFVATRVRELEGFLNSLPEADRPGWSLEKEMLAGADTSRIAEAALSQPLCTAIQIVLVDLLLSSGISFSSVVGHSSGEIGAAYAAGLLSDKDALRIAYYRGVYAELAGNAATNRKGSMMAVGTTWEDAQDLLRLRAFKGRLAIAAHNSSASVTLSGDIDAILHAKKVFDEEKKFSRVLKVDTAYHSHHMLPCGDPYVAALKACGVTVKSNPNPSCSWFSSVTADARPVESSEALQGTYWQDNMQNAVLFSDAIKNAMQADDQIAYAIEVGPHPALKGPAAQNIGEVRSTPLPYTGILSRGKSGVHSFSDALGFVWNLFGSQGVDFSSYERLVSGTTSDPKLVVGLPSYKWNHARAHWLESRRSRKIRGRPQPFHELLGVRCPDSTDREVRWQNVLKASEIPWMEGHQLQGQTVFPAAGYCAVAIEAARSVAGDSAVEVLELHNLSIPRAITFEDDTNTGVEILVTLTGITTVGKDTTADFALYSCPVSGAEQEMELTASGNIRISVGEPHLDTLSSTRLPDSNMVAVDTDRFYASLSRLGYGYYQTFRGMSSLKRRLNQSSVMVDTYPYQDSDSTVYLVHPTWLDVAFQASMLAFSAPGDERLWSLHVPTAIRSIRLNPEVCGTLPLSQTKIPVCSVLSDTREFSASIDLFNEDGSLAMVQVEDLEIKPFAPATAADDRRLFSWTKLDVASPDGASVVQGTCPTASEAAIAALCERVSLYYLRKWKAEIADEDWADGQPHYSALRDYMNYVLDLVTRGRHPTIKKQWMGDTPEDINSLTSEFPNDVDINLLRAVGENIPAAVRGETTILEHMLPNNLLNDFYKKGLGFATYNTFLARMMKQLVHRYPHAKILEIGAGTGGATAAVLNSIGHKMSSYTYTDISVGFFEKATEIFKEYSDKMTFKTLDVEKSPSTQGYQTGAYDIVIASNVLHATSSMQKTLEHTRQLLKPGGYLMLLELTSNGPVRFSNIMGGLAGWWLGVDDGRKYAPTMTPSQWHSCLRKAGFGGVDAITPEIDTLAWPFSIIASQAVDERVDFLRKPLTRKSKSSSSTTVFLESVVILGGTSLEGSRIAEEITEILERFSGEIITLDGLPTEDEAASLAPMSTFINLVDIDTPIFQDVTSDTIEGLNRVYELAKNILWVTHRAQTEEPYHMASITFSRSIHHETGHINMNHLDVSDLDDNVSKSIVEHLLRQCALMEWGGGTGYRNENDKIIWSKEPETYLERGLLKIPRLVDNVGQNSRLNSARRVITTSATAESDMFLSASDSGSLALIEQSIPTSRVKNSTEGVVKVDLSSVHAINVAVDSFLFVGIGKEGGKSTVTLSDANSREIVPVASTATDASLSLQSQLVSTVAELLASALLRKVSPGSSVLIHASGNDRLFAGAVSRQAAEKSIRVTFSCDASSSADAPASWIKLSARTPRHIVGKSVLPFKPSHFLDLTILNNELSLANINNAVINANSAVSWMFNGDVKVEVRPLESDRLFSKDKTYLLVGLTGQIGQSLCEWMVANGAGCVCLTSRNPKIDAKWLASFKDSGSDVKVFSLDVTDKNAVEKVVDEVKATCPPISGVANGAMVLHDCLFSKMSADIFRKVLGPKIDGSRHLDEIFHDDDLDFFILFSSSACVIGNSGQSNYAAANGYLNTLARQRRRRGLAASAFDIGRVAGIGYVETAGQAVMDQLTRFGLMAISETEFRQMFAETIRAGYPRPEDRNESIVPFAVVTTCIRTISDDEESGPWFDNAIFSHCIIEANGSKSDDGNASKKNSLPVSEQLACAADKDQALDLLQECFATKLKIMLQISGQEINPETSLVELGVDSLVAVEVRSWFLKELQADVPVLKIVGGATVAELCQRALDKNFSHSSGLETQARSRSPISTDSKGASTPATEPTSRSGSPDGVASKTASMSSPPPQRPAAERPVRRFLKPELMSFGQSRFWFLRLLLDDPTTSNVSFYYKVTGSLRIGDLEKAVRQVTIRHETLRTAFVEHETRADQAYQKVMSSSPVRLELKKASSVDEVVEYRKLQKHVSTLEDGELIRLVLVSLSPTDHYLLFNYHHITMDGVSFQVFVHDLEKAYKGQSLGPAPRQFLNYSRAQRRALESGELDDQLKYWRTIFPDDQEPPVLPLLPMARTTSRLAMKNFGVHQVMERIEPDVVARIKTMSKSQKSTPFHFYLATFKTMLFSFTETSDLTIGIADANRNEGNVANSIGFFLNLLTLRFRRQDSQRFSDAISEARRTTYGALGNSRLPFDILLKELNVTRSPDYSPFFQAFFDYRQGAQEKFPWADARFEFQELHPGRTAYDITLDVTDNATDSLIKFRVQTGLLVSAWSATLPSRIDGVARDSKDRPAAKDDLGNHLTYAELIDRTEAIAEALQSSGVSAGHCVPVFQTASADWICSMLAIVRLGAVYPAAVLVDTTTRDDVEQLNVPNASIIDVSTVGAEVSKPVGNVSKADEPAAILYTSGSTGTPKGIVVTHAGLRNEIEGYTNMWKLGAERTLQQSAFTFNHSCDQIYTGLSNGGIVYVVPWSKRGEPEEIARIIREEGITYTKATPAEYSLWLQYGIDHLKHATSWRAAFGGGEPMTSALTNAFADLNLPQLRLHNSYGLTEVSISSTKLELDYHDREAMADGRFPCGLSLSNYHAYIVDDKLQPLPAGMPGELCIGGAGVSLGYLKNRELTGKLFVANPFATADDVANGWTRMYRTGDICHLQDDGSMVFHNRIAGGTQVRIRGLRIELSDIESNIVATSEGVVKEAVVSLRRGDPDFLVAHVAFTAGHEPDTAAEAEAYLDGLLSRLQIPQYMVPVMAIAIEKMPLTNHSKTDRRALKEIALPRRTQAGARGAVGDEELTETMLQLKSTIYRFLPAQVSRVATSQFVLDEFVRPVDVSGIAPDLTGWDGRMDMMPAQQASSWILDSILDSAENGRVGVNFKHIENPTVVDIEELRSTIKAERPRTVGSEMMPGLKWIGHIKKLGFDFLLTSQEASVQGGGAEGVFVSRR
ncbi:hypothetical protein GMORB2_4868 [Geosmithia morbida]|uniref:Polyketide synthase n=1 Tax=Geosmithia morbida TaxID=1094350 RepID=A0A9P4YPD1_9HYPO|nr:uncharacterized protein GMORB2_4868 [Geosmithia morbida]KAF4119349.1 hypothetical protein GMORB2_4868 [Geosmithia morbida]